MPEPWQILIDETHEVAKEFIRANCYNPEVALARFERDTVVPGNAIAVTVMMALQNLENQIL